MTFTTLYFIILQFDKHSDKGNTYMINSLRITYKVSLEFILYFVLAF